MAISLHVSTQLQVYISEASRISICFAMNDDMDYRKIDAKEWQITYMALLLLNA